MNQANFREILRDQKNIFNRLKSIEEDAAFVKEIAELFPKLALVANERCGSWYIDPAMKAYSVYFKSTDGHMGHWDFSIRRANFHLIDIIVSHGGCIIVDSTRRGKRMPDSLSKTVPIWCCTINRAVNAYRRRQNESNIEDSSSSLEFHSQPSAVSRSEHTQINARIENLFVQSLLDSGLDIAHLAKVLEKPLRPIWFSPPAPHFFEDPDGYSDSPFYPVICVSASQQVDFGCQHRPTYMYVQGSADDQEAWSQGLTRQLFWKHRHDILNVQSASDCESIVKRLVCEAKESECDEENEQLPEYHFIEPTRIAIGNLTSGKPPACWDNFDIVINCTDFEYKQSTEERERSRYLQLPIPRGKKGQVVLFSSIPAAIAFLHPHLADNKRILIHSVDGQDRSVGIALAVLVNYFTVQGQFQPESNRHVDKAVILQHLVRITKSHIKASPSRATLKKINTFFMSSGMARH